MFRSLSVVILCNWTQDRWGEQKSACWKSLVGQRSNQEPPRDVQSISSTIICRQDCFKFDRTVMCNQYLQASSAIKIASNLIEISEIRLFEILKINQNMVLNLDPCPYPKVIPCDNLAWPWKKLPTLFDDVPITNCDFYGYPPVNYHNYEKNNHLSWENSL